MVVVMGSEKILNNHIRITINLGNRKHPKNLIISKLLMAIQIWVDKAKTGKFKIRLLIPIKMCMEVKLISHLKMVKKVMIILQIDNRKVCHKIEE